MEAGLRTCSGGADLGTAEARISGLQPSLESPRSPAHTPHVSTKQIVQDLLQKLPENVSLHDVAQEIEFVAAVRQGLAEIDRGERIPIEEIERELPSWVIR
jgi:predicted transcriptional regulator